MELKAWQLRWLDSSKSSLASVATRAPRPGLSAL